MYSTSTLIWISWVGEPSGYAEYLDNRFFSLKIGYTGSLKFGCYSLQYVPAPEPFDYA